MSTNDLRQAVGAQRVAKPVTEFSNFMDKLKPQLALALPKHLTSDRMARLAMTAFSTSQHLQRCTHQSIAASIMTAAQLGLEPGVNGAGYLIPYKDTCTFVPGWKGLVDLVSRSGRGTVFTGVIMSDQEYTFTDGARRDLVIHNETELDGPDNITHAYAVGWVKDSSMPIIELWTVGKIRKHRDHYNKVGQRHYSYGNWEMYCRKIPLLQVIKYMPSSIEMSNALAVSQAAEEGRGTIIENGIVIDLAEQPRESVDRGQAETVDTATGEIKPEVKSEQKAKPEPKAKPEKKADPVAEAKTPIPDEEFDEDFSME